MVFTIYVQPYTDSMRNINNANIDKIIEQNTIYNAFKYADIRERQKIIKVHETQRRSKLKSMNNK